MMGGMVRYYTVECYTVEWVLLPRIISEGDVSKFAPHKAIQLNARGKLTFDKRVVLHRVVGPRPKVLTPRP